MVRISEKTRRRWISSTLTNIANRFQRFGNLIRSRKLRDLSRKSPKTRLSDQVRAILAIHDARGEQAIAIAQGAIAVFVLLLHLGANLGGNAGTANHFMMTTLAALAISSAVRYELGRLPRLPERTLDFLNVLDVTIFLWLIWNYQFAYELPAGSVLKAASLNLLFALVAARALRFHPRPILTAGIVACLGWIVMVFAAVAKEGTASITHDYPTYLTTYKVMIGAEMERLVALAAIVICLAMGAAAARRLLISLDSTVENMPQGVVVFDAGRKITAYNSQFGKLFCLSRDELKLGMSLKDLLHLLITKGQIECENFDDFYENWITEADAGLSRIQEMKSGQIFSITRKRMIAGGFLSTTEDVTEQRLMKHLAFHDPLTGLPNRLHLSQCLEQLVEEKCELHTGAVLCLDLDRFKQVNDTLGHQIGDEILMSTAKRLKNCVRGQDTIVRTGGDEFVILLAAEDPVKVSSVLARRIIMAMALPFHIHGHEVFIGTTIGITIFERKVTDADILLRQADTALYRAKEEGRGTFRFFKNDMDQDFQSVVCLESDLRKAIVLKQLQAVFQPVLNFRSGRFRGLETQLEWIHPDQGVIPADELFPAAERIGFSIVLEEFMIEEACKMAAALPDDVSVAVDLSSRHLAKPGLYEFVTQMLEKYHAVPGQLEIGFTEEAVFKGTEMTFETLKRFSAAGVGISLNDFGAGFSSISYLYRYPFDKIRIDPSITRNAASSKGAHKILRAILRLAREMNIAVTAVGVETQEEFEIISEMGCSDVQGDFVKPPQSASAIRASIGMQTHPAAHLRRASSTAS
jgi:diguanylate cyclase (GGDEF)-like protein